MSIFNFRIVRFSIFSLIVNGIFCISIVPILLILRPLINIQFHIAASDRIGEFLASISYITWHQESKPQFPRKRVIVFGPPACNRFLESYFSQEIKFFLGRRILFVVNTLRHSINFFGLLFTRPSSVHSYTLLNKQTKIITLNKQDKKRGIEELSRFGISQKNWFISYHARDSRYLNNSLTNIEFSYHNYRDCSALNYLKSAEYIASNGGYTFRLGVNVDEKLPDKISPKIIDYASFHRTDFLDVYLCTESKFIIGNTSGLYLIALYAGVPVAGTNIIPYSCPPQSKKDLFIPKLLKCVKSGNILSFSEICERKLDNAYLNQDYIDANVIPIENSPDEILDLSLEMLEKINRSTIPSGHIKLQKEFKRRFMSQWEGFEEAGDISYKFLLRHPHLMA